MAPNPAHDLAAAAEFARQMRERLLRDPHRPRYHFTVPEGVAMPFDPNGAIFWRGRYHLFYIFQDPRGHCWGHASSRDLVHWIHHPTALAPNAGDVDRGTFSGNAFVNARGQPTILYHGVSAGNCIATSEDPELIHWVKTPHNPIVRSPQKGDPEHGQYESWDPHGWVEDGMHYAVFGGRPATLFRSADLARWEYLHPFLAGGNPLADADEDVSCPDFFALGDKHVLLCISHRRGCRCYVGRYENHVFTPESHQRMNWPGGTCFAPESLRDDRGRRIMWAWVLDRRTPRMIEDGGSSGEMTLPRVLSLAGDGTLRIEPPEELQALRCNPRQWRNLSLTPQRPWRVPDVAGDCLEVRLDIDVGQARQVGLRVRCSPDGAESTGIVGDRDAGVLRMELSRSSLDPDVVHRQHCMIFDGSPNPPVQCQEAPFVLSAGERLNLRVFLDRSMLEVFANGRQCVTQRIYPTRPDSLGLELFCAGGDAAVESLSVWDMAATNAW